MILSASPLVKTIPVDMETSGCSLNGGITTSDKTLQTLFTSFSFLLIHDFVKSLFDIFLLILQVIMSTSSQ